MQIKLSPGALDNIKTKLARMNAESANAFKFQWRIDILDEYKKKVSSLMGTVDSRGGYPIISISGVPTDGSVQWEPLSPFTTMLKEAKGARTVIWQDTGATKRSLESFAVTSDHVAITSAYARLVEEGDGSRIPSRPLFGLANHLVLEAIKKACRDENSALGRNMRNGFVDFARAQGWGSK